MNSTFEYLSYTLKERIEERMNEIPKYRDKVSPKILQERIKFYQDIILLMDQVDDQIKASYIKGLDIGRRGSSSTAANKYNKEQTRADHAWNQRKRWEDYY